MTARLSLRYAALSDLGRYRKDNQDSGFASERLLVVADGVGGAAFGDVASHTAVQIMRRLDQRPPDDLLEALAGAIHRVHDRLGELVEQDPELDGTSTTITAGLFDGTRLGLAHLGDSRAYLLRQGEIRQLTKDHTFVQTLVDEGRISEEESRSHPHRNLILRAVDGVHDTEPDLFSVELEHGDRLLFCSDGCSGVLDNASIAGILGEGSVDFAAVELVRASLDAGTTDNVTVVVADVVEEGAPVDAETSAAAVTGPMLVGAAAGQPRKLAGSGQDGAHAAGRVRTEHDIAPDFDDLEPDPEELRYAPRAPRRLLWVRRAAVLVALGVVLFSFANIGYDWSQRQYYISDDGDHVAIYRGVDLDLPLVTMYRVAEVSDVTLAALPGYRARQVREGIEAGSLEDARRIVNQNLWELATKCPAPEEEESTSRRGRQTPAPSPTPTPSPSPSPSPTPSLAPPDCVEADTTTAATP